MEVLCMENLKQESSKRFIENEDILFAVISNCNSLKAFCGGAYNG